MSECPLSNFNDLDRKVENISRACYLPTRVRELESRIEVLIYALKNYGVHDTQCDRERDRLERGDVFHDPKVPCTCGLSKSIGEQ
jgi:hypothetical protein